MSIIPIGGITFLNGRKSGSTGFGTSVNTSSNATSKDESFTSNSSNAQATDSVSERTHTTKEDDIPSFIRNREERRSRRTRR